MPPILNAFHNSICHIISRDPNLRSTQQNLFVTKFNTSLGQVFELSNGFTMSKWAHQRSRLYSVTFFLTTRLVLITAQVMLIAPILRCGSLGRYRTHLSLTSFAILTFLVLCGAAPFLLRVVTSTYKHVSVQHDNIFLLIAMISQVSDISIVLFTLLSQIWQRQRLCEFLNRLENTLQRIRTLRGRHFINGRVLLLLWLQLALTLYDLLTQLVFLVNLIVKIDALHFFINLAALYLQQGRATLLLLIMSFVLLLAACYAQLAHSLEDFALGFNLEPEHFEELISLQNALDGLIQKLIKVFQLPLCLIVCGEFINVLANLYAQLYYYVITKAWWFAFVFYCAKISIELYLIIHVVYFCCELRMRVTQLFLDRDLDIQEGSEWRFVLTHSDVLWPQPIKFYILGLFELNNEFWLFLVEYSVNFIVIILQFGFYT